MAESVAKPNRKPDNGLQIANIFYETPLDILPELHKLIENMGTRQRRIYPDLRTYFEESGDTQVAFAARMKRSQAWVSRVTNGQTEPSIREALAISRLTGVPLESLSARRGDVASIE